MLILKFILSLGLLLHGAGQHHAHGFNQIAQCESNHRAHINTGNGYYGAFQFSEQTWKALGYKKYPNDYSYQYQKQAAEKLQRIQGWQAWPVCSEGIK